LEAQQAHLRIQDKALPCRPRAFAGAAHLEGGSRALDGHSLDYKGAGVRLPDIGADKIEDMPVVFKGPIDGGVTGRNQAGIANVLTFLLQCFGE
jgi:hypothetical protein